MRTATTEIRLRGRLVDALYTEAMVLADEARACFERVNAEARGAMTPINRIVLSCESLKVTTRLMHILSWLLAQRAAEMGQADNDGAVRRIGVADDSDMAELEDLPGDALNVIEASRELYARVARFDPAETPEEPATSPALNLISRLERAF
jgi:regulator of CtrA degradation